MPIDETLRLLLTAAQLKVMPRTGWLQRGVPDAESVAAHSYGVVLAALLLCELVDAPLDVTRVLAMAALHDLPEALVSDIPAPARRFAPSDLPALKARIERAALQEMTDGVPVSAPWLALWDELAADATPEARLVHDADKLDLYLQAYLYEEATGNRRLEQFWHRPHQFHFDAAQALYDALRGRRG